MKFVIDKNIPYVNGIFESYGEVIYKSGGLITDNDIKDADVLMIRTRTLCNENLLKNSSVKMIATATIGYDHIDTAYCKTANIHWENAPGCNSSSVEQYIIAVLLTLAQRHHFSLKDKTIGIIGAGNVGSKVANKCSLLGMKVLMNDPPRSREEGSDKFVSIETIQNEADIITFHVPLTYRGDDVTFQMCNQSFLSELKDNVIIINSARGEVVDSTAMKEAISNKKIKSFVCDCWENEPFIDNELLSLCEISTPHIAGYSRDSKANGTMMSVRAISRFFNLGIDKWQPAAIELPTLPIIHIDGANLTQQEVLSKIILATYDPSEEDILLKFNPKKFEEIRDNYPLRREYSAYSVKIDNVDSATLDIIKKFGFFICS